ncbi:MAG: hypothetical protein AB7D24_09635 [Sphaerochaeta sp.]|uniref:hypothetical protein n=1 Tax=Sphaerochaeta sp. TaxID=1972642 RepID=UPI003D0EB226
MKPTKDLIGMMCWYNYHLYRIVEFGFNAIDCWLVIEKDGKQQKVDFMDVELSEG